MKKIPFSVDSTLLSELGERLVGAPHIALAELVKNSYDADATRVIIRFRPDRLEVIDNGHGMSFEEFRSFWMRIGTPHKQAKRISRELNRPMTGSKGVGRLAVQFLAANLELRTVSAESPNLEIRAQVDWEQAVKAGELTQAVAEFDEAKPKTKFADGNTHGTAVILSRLKQDWNPEQIVKLAQEIWWLQPPFRPNPNSATAKGPGFDVTLESPDADTIGRFESQMAIVRDIWYARLVGKLSDEHTRGPRRARLVQLSLEFAGESPIHESYEIPQCQLHGFEFEIRIFHLERRQPHGIKVGVARDYFNQFGGVYVYDTGFHLPFYGRKENDWLGTEIDHSHRLSRSKLLPENLQVAEGMNYLPTQSRLLGVVHVNTSRERELSLRHGPKGEEDYLKISVTRDRLVDNDALKQLRHAVRWALDFYAMQEARRGLDRANAKREVEPASAKFAHVDQVLTEYKEQIPKPVYSRLRTQVQEAVAASETEAELMAGQIGLLGPLATAGISAIAYEHEVSKQFQLLDDVIERLEELATKHPSIATPLRDTQRRLQEWLERARATRALFSPMMEEESRVERNRLRAHSVVDQVGEQMSVLLRGVELDSERIDGSLYLPCATFAEWSAICQNIFMNAINAMLDSPTKRIVVCSRTRGKKHSLVVMDTGKGVDLSTANDLFKPFVRKLAISQERRRLGLGGTGLGLTIVKMIAENIHCAVRFVEPEDGYKTAFEISWSETG